MKLFTKDTLAPFDWFLIIGIFTTNIVYSILTEEIDLIGSIAGITGLLCVVLVAKRSMSNYIFGIINVSLYAYISYKSAIYGDALLNALYYLPMQFIGWYAWIGRKGGVNSQGQSDDSLVKTRAMTPLQRVMLFVFCLAFTLIAGYLLDKYTLDGQPYKDSFTTVLSVIAMFLMVRAYLEQWVLWVVVNGVSVIMWCILWLKGGEHAALMVIMWIFYLANSINGLRVWSRCQ